MRVERVVVTGGRKFADGARIEADLRALVPLGLRRVAEGQCPLGGADNLAYQAWTSATVDGEGVRYPMNHALDGPGKSAFLRRNERMLDAEKPDLVLAYPDPESRGTWHCVKAALARNIPVAIWAPHMNRLGVEQIITDACRVQFVVFDDEPRFIVAPPPAERAGPRPLLGILPVVAKALRGMDVVA